MNRKRWSYLKHQWNLCGKRTELPRSGVYIIRRERGSLRIKQVPEEDPEARQIPLDSVYPAETIKVVVEEPIEPCLPLEPIPEPPPPY